MTDNIDTCIRFWKKLQDDNVKVECVNLFPDRIMHESDDSLGINYRVVSTYSMDGIIEYSYFQFVTYSFVNIFRCKVPIHVIEDLFQAVWNSAAERQGLMEEISLKFICRVEYELKCRGWKE